MRDPKIQAWIDALRSEDYPQIKGKLHNDQGFCAVGVLCDVQGARWTQDNRDNSFFVLDVYNRPHWCIMPPSLTPEGMVWEKYADLNDEEGFTFNQIADVIEEDFPNKEEG